MTGSGVCRRNPPRRRSYGDRRYNDRWPDLSQQALERRHRDDQAALAALAAIDRDDLDTLDQVNYDLFQRNLQNRLDIYRFGRQSLYGGNEATPMNQRDGVQTAYDLAESLRFEREQDYRDWISRLQRFGVYVDQTIALFQDALDRGIAQPRIIVERIRDQLPPLLGHRSGCKPLLHAVRDHGGRHFTGAGRARCGPRPPVP